MSPYTTDYLISESFCPSTTQIYANIQATTGIPILDPKRRPSLDSSRPNPLLRRDEHVKNFQQLIIPLKRDF
jgi:hypothetical protein